ncbi:MAG: AAA family ATPase [Candidatus Uhrbacteria bacterium]
MSDSASGIIGHEKIVSFLTRSLDGGRLSQAYLFVGPAGVGKTAVAEWLIKKILGAQGFDHPDVTVLSRLVDEKTEKVKSEIVVDQVRKLRERLSMSGFMGGPKIAFIEEADVLNNEASNALLKTLEEPTSGTTLILRATSVDRVLPTIASRCQIIRFTSVPRLKIVEALASRGVIKKEAEALAALSGGCPGYALNLLRDEETRSLEETSVEQFVNLLRSPISVRLARAADLLPKDEVNKKEQLKNLLDRWEWLLRDVLLISVGSEEWAPRAGAYPEIIKLAKDKKADHWLKALENLRVIKNDLAFHVNPTLALEHLFLSF